jgi:pre-mRNA-splicing factor CDC5/CEF1
MKIYIRGGPWSNAEDQVLLAAYMKYGGNQWLRIASLLPKKSPAQVKARWEEYLDPTLRKTAWTQKEDEKLMYFAKVMPTQWRTIAQYFGRTSHQCVDRYREIVDKVTGTPHQSDNDSAIAHRMLPNFETWDAMPDPVDMDQESKEMLAEARARLANTQGKKARRKARERQLDVLRKLTTLRKARELESAGLIIGKKNVWEDEEWEMDVITTHQAKPGVYDTTKDDETANKERVNRIKRKIAANKKAKKKKEESELGSIKEELKKEESRLTKAFSVKHPDLTLREPHLGEDEFKNIEWLRHLNEDFLTRPHELSLLKVGRTVHQHDSWEQLVAVDEFKSQPLSKGLPRPFPVSVEPLTVDFETEADHLVVEEMMKLVLRDARDAPQGKRVPIALLVPACFELEDKLMEFVEIPQEMIVKADALIKEERGDISVDYEEFGRIWEEVHENLPDVDFENGELKKKVAKKIERYESATRSSRIRIQGLIQAVRLAREERDRLKLDAEVYEWMRVKEEESLKARISWLRNHKSEMEAERQALDQEYAQLKRTSKL